MNAAKLVHTQFVLAQVLANNTEQNSTFVFLKTSLQLQIVFFHLSYPLQAASDVHFNLMSPVYKHHWGGVAPRICPCLATPRGGHACRVRLVSV